MFDYFNSTRKANHILARIAKTTFNSAETKPIVECRGTFASSASEKIILRLSKIDGTAWKICAPLVMVTEGSGENIINSGDIFNPLKEKSKEKLAKKRKIDGNNLQVGRTEDDRVPSKKRCVIIRKIKSRTKEDVSENCVSKPPIRRSNRLAAKAVNKIEDSSGTDFNFSAVAIQSKVRRKDPSCLKVYPHKPSRRIQSVRSNSNVQS